MSKEIMQYDIILADPPWRFDFCVSKTRAIENHYETMDLGDICRMEVPAKENCILFLWSPPTFLKKALKVMDAWGFDYVTDGIWDKGKIGMGYWFRAQHETLLVGRKGQFSPPQPENRVSSIVKARRKEHSVKPINFHKIIERMFPGKKYIELFARERRYDWTAWGNEVSDNVQLQFQEVEK